MIILPGVLAIHFRFLVRRIIVLFSTDVAAMGVDTPDLNIGVSLGEISFSTGLKFSVNSIQEQLERGGASCRLQEGSVGNLPRMPSS